MKHFRILPAFLALSGAFAAPAQANYRAKALEATEFIQRNFYDAKAGLYRGSAPADPKGLPYEVMWGNGVEFSVLTAATRYEPAQFRPVLDNFTKGLNRYWDAAAPIPGFDAYFSGPDNDDKYYDDNAWLVLGFAEAFRVTKDPQFLDWSQRTHDFVLSGYDDKLDGGIYWYQNKKESKNTCINAPAATSALELYEISHKPEDLAWAKRLYAWTNAHLQDADGLYWDNISLDGKIEKTKWTYNTALMIRANVGLWRATKDAKYLAEARRISDASLKRWVQPGGGFADAARFNHLLAEALLVAYDATRDIKYLNAVRRHADYGYRYVRDVRDGGYWNNWNAETRAPNERKTLIENAGAARTLWLLVPYSDVEELQAKGEAAEKKGATKQALAYFGQAFASTAGAVPTQEAPPQKAAVETAVG